MGATIHTYKWLNGALTHLSDTFIFSEGFTEGKGSAIRISHDGRFLYATERATETILVFSVDGEKLTLIQRIDCRGTEPRDFLIVGNGAYAICANQFGDNCSLYKVLKDGTLTYVRSFEIAAPISIIEAN